MKMKKSRLLYHRPKARKRGAGISDENYFLQEPKTPRSNDLGVSYLVDANLFHIAIQEVLGYAVQIAVGTDVIQFFDRRVREVSCIQTLKLGSVCFIYDLFTVIIGSNNDISGLERWQAIL